MEIEKAKSLDIARLLAFRGLMSGNNTKWLTSARKPLETKGFRAFMQYWKKRDKKDEKNLMLMLCLMLVTSLIACNKTETTDGTKPNNDESSTSNEIETDNDEFSSSDENTNDSSDDSSAKVDDIRYV